MGTLDAYDTTIGGDKAKFGGEEQTLPLGAYLVTLHKISLKEPTVPIKNENYDKWGGGSGQISMFFSKIQRAETRAVNGAIDSSPEVVAKALAANAKIPYFGWQIPNPDFYFVGVPENEKADRREQGKVLENMSNENIARVVRAFQLWKILGLNDEFAEAGTLKFLNAFGEFNQAKPQGFIQVVMGKAWGNREAREEIKVVTPDLLSEDAQKLIGYEPPKD